MDKKKRLNAIFGSLGALAVLAGVISVIVYWKHKKIT